MATTPPWLPPRQVTCAQVSPPPNDACDTMHSKSISRCWMRLDSDVAFWCSAHGHDDSLMFDALLRQSKRLLGVAVADSGTPPEACARLRVVMGQAVRGSS
jgi:hypothetical protein